jgi:hypothetical protein
MRKFFTVSSCLLVFFAFVFLAGLPLRAQLTEDERNTIDIVKKAKNSVVFITNIQLVRDFFFNQEQVPRGSGWIKEGYKADIVVMNLKTLKTPTSISNPHQRSREVKFILINGRLALDKGTWNGALPGQVLKLKKS